MFPSLSPTRSALTDAFIEPSFLPGSASLCACYGSVEGVEIDDAARPTFLSVWNWVVLRMNKTA